MRENLIVKILVKDDVSAPMRPAADVYGDADYGRMARAVLDIHAEHGVFAHESLRTKPDGVDAVFEQLLHLSGTRIWIV